MQNKKLNVKALENLKNMGNGNKGITLIALVVTIVVLLILAGITIELTLGNDGIINKTKFTKDQSCIQSDKEAIQIAYSTVYHLHDKAVTAQNLQEQLIYDGKDAECETVEDNKIKVKITKCEHEFLVDPTTGSIESTNSSGTTVENKISIEVNPASNETASYKQQVSITVKSSRETITDNSVKILWTTDNSDNEPAELVLGTDLSVENTNEKTISSETVYTATASGDYYLWVKASINGKSSSQKFGPYKLLAAPSAKDIIFTPSTDAPTTSLNVKIAPSANFPGYVLQYQVASSVNSSAWKNYTSQVNITENTTIWARLYNASEDKEVVTSFVVTNICAHTSGWTVEGENHYCKLCGYSEKHSYQDSNSTGHICITCSNFEEHKFIENGTNYHFCSECGAMYNHTFENYDSTSHKCSQCGYIESHTYDPSGNCTICNTSCTHTFTYNTEQGIATCLQCGLTCNHGNTALGWGDSNLNAHFEYDQASQTSTCSYCGYVCDTSSHKWNSSIETGPMNYQQYHKCSICNIEAEHYFELDGHCMACNYQCTHYWQDGMCIYCKSVCAHVNSYGGGGDYSMWSNGMCSICGELCKHFTEPVAWMNGRCMYCGMECDHNTDTSLWVDGRCSKCGMECTHSWMDGRCTICGKECEHSYNSMLWSNGVCMTCGYICQHQYDSTTGMCTICGMECMHSFMDGTCMYCGYTDPTYSGM